MPPVIDSVHRLREKIHLLEALQEIHLTQKLINLIFAQKLKGEHKMEEINPLDQFYAFLNVKINRLDPVSRNF